MRTLLAAALTLAFVQASTAHDIYKDLRERV